MSTFTETLHGHRAEALPFCSRQSYVVVGAHQKEYSVFRLNTIIKLIFQYLRIDVGK
ncbi:hypothetical protein ACVW2L_003621 [Mucilaginibacter sp. HD30]